MTTLIKDADKTNAFNNINGLNRHETSIELTSLPEMILTLA
jgi:hypothetical protein